MSKLPNLRPAGAAPAEPRYEGSLVEDGFTIIRNAISPQLLQAFQQSVNRSLCDLASPALGPAADCTDPAYFKKAVKHLIAQRSGYDLLKPVWKNLIRQDLLNDLFLQPAIYRFIGDVLGKDLCYQDDPSLTLNLPGVANSKQNYLFKGFHQEVWSGASVNTLQFWAPLFQQRPEHGIVFIKGSHLWGHIPHRNREPLELPAGHTETSSDLALGDAVVFHSLLLHRSAPIPKAGQPRLALPCLVKNFKYSNDSFEKYRNWKIFSYSDLSLIDRRLGNHYLSPFRLVDLPPQQFTGGIT